MDKNAAPYMGTVKVGAKGQIVIPKEIRDMFGIEPGHSLAIFAHPEKGIGIQQQAVLEKMANAIFSGRGSELLPNEDPQGLPIFAEKIRETLGKGETNESD